MRGRHGKRRTAGSKQIAKPSSEVLLCSVCAKGEGKYKCPKCRAPFCCVQCSKDHRANQCPATTKVPGTADAATTNGNGTLAGEKVEQSQYLRQEELKRKQPLRKRIRRTGSGDDSDSHDDEPGWNTTGEMKERLRQSAWIRKELQDGGLRQMIEQIDAASEDEEEDARGSQPPRRRNGNASRAFTARELALARSKHANPKFASFVDKMLLTAGILQPADGDSGTGSNMLEENCPLILAPVPRRVGVNNTESDSQDSSSSSDDSEGESSDSSDDSDSSQESEGSISSG